MCISTNTSLGGEHLDFYLLAGAGCAWYLGWTVAHGVGLGDCVMPLQANGKLLAQLKGKGFENGRCSRMQSLHKSAVRGPLDLRHTREFKLVFEQWSEFNVVFFP